MKEAIEKITKQQLNVNFMADEKYSKVKIISELFIRPNFEVEQSKQTHYLSTNDLYQLSTSYMHRGLLYANPSSLPISSLVDKLKSSLSIVLVDFYPLAGRLETVEYEDEGSSWVYVDCNKGPGARLIHATTTEDFKMSVSDIVSLNKNVGRDLFSFFDVGERDVVNHDGHTRPLLSVQVTDLVDGVFIGFAMNHSLADGSSLWQFIKALSNVFMDRDHNKAEKPILKAVFPDGYGPVLKLPYLDPNEFITRLDVDPRLTLRVFHFTAESIASIKAQAQEKSNDHPISSFQALSAFVWLSIARARNLPPDTDMVWWLTADTRPRCDPPLPSNQFGNFVRLVSVTSKMEELMRNGLGWAAMQLHKAILGLDDKVIRAFTKARAESPQVAQLKLLSRFGDNPPVTFAGSMRFDAYGPEFGLGKAVATRTGYSNWMTGRIVVDPGREGVGGADLQVCLLSETMTALESDDELMTYVS